MIHFTCTPTIHGGVQRLILQVIAGKTNFITKLFLNNEFQRYVLLELKEIQKEEKNQGFQYVLGVQV